MATACAAEGLRPRLERDQPVVADAIPALVDHRGGKERAGFGNRGVHRHEVAVVDAEVRAERPAHGVRRLLLGQRRAGLHAGHVREHGLAADAVLVPALHGAAGARPAVVFARPLVVALGHLVEHARADGLRVGDDGAAAEQVVRHGGEAEAGAGALGALVEDRHLPPPVLIERDAHGHLDERRPRTCGRGSRACRAARPVDAARRACAAALASTAPLRALFDFFLAIALRPLL